MKIVAFTKKNPKHKQLNYPKEDSFKYHRNGDDEILVAVADGITRDPKGIEKYPDINDDEEIVKKASENYPRPSPAKKAADLFCRSFINYMKKIKLQKNSIRGALGYSNKEICKLNEGLEVDYLENDFWACVGVAGAIKENILYYGYVADCGVCVFDKNGKLKFKTKNEGPNSNGDIDGDIVKKYKIHSKFPAGRKIIRSRYRNNSKNPLSYGAFTGEEKVLDFIRTGEIYLDGGDLIVFYSDGMPSIIFSENFNIFEYFDDLKEYVDKNADKIDGGEGTLVAINLQNQ